jgi:restriction system protein
MFDQVELTPEEFERQVEHMLRRSGVGLRDFKVQRREKLAGADGVYEIDVTARFEALGADFLVLIECKHHRSPIKRDLVQVLRDRIQTIGAHKGMLFATTGYQRGALEYAAAHGIALVTIADGRASYHTRSRHGPVQYPPGLPQYVGWIRALTADGSERLKLLDAERPEFVIEAFSRVV